MAECGIFRFLENRAHQQQKYTISNVMFNLQQKTHFINAVHSTTISNVYFCDEQNNPNAFLPTDESPFHLAVCVVGAVDFLGVFFSCFARITHENVQTLAVYLPFALYLIRPAHTSTFGWLLMTIGILYIYRWIYSSLNRNYVLSVPVYFRIKKNRRFQFSLR